MADRIFNWGDVRVSRTLPTGYYDFKIEGLEEQHSKAKGLLMYVVECVVLGPSSQVGKKYTEYMLFGKSPFDTQSEDAEFQQYAELDDPDAEDPLTAKYSNGMRTFRKVFEAAGLNFQEEVGMDFLMEAANSGQLEFGARIFAEEDGEGKSRNNIGSCYQKGAETPRIESVKQNGRGPAARAASKRPPSTAEKAASRTRATAETD